MDVSDSRFVLKVEFIKIVRNLQTALARKNVHVASRNSH